MTFRSAVKFECEIWLAEHWNFRHNIARNAADGGYTKKFVAPNVAEVGRNSTAAILRATILGVEYTMQFSHCAQYCTVYPPFISVSTKKLMRKKVKRTSKSPFASKMPVCTNQLHKRIKLFLLLPSNKHLVNRAKSVCMGESWPRSCVQTSLPSICTYDLGQDSPIQTSCSVNKSYVLLQILNN